MAHAHRNKRSRPARVQIATVSSTRTLETDKGGPVLARVLEQAGHQVVDRCILPDDPARIAGALRGWADDDGLDAVVLTGGTGISRRDGTIEAVTPLLDRVLPGFGELFRMLSFEQVGAAAMLSRAIGGLCGETLVFAVPGSPRACELAASRLIGPELAHLVYELGKEAQAEATEESDGPRQEGGLHLSQTRTPAAPEPEEPEPLEGWFATLAELGGTLVRGERLALPETLTGIAAANQVLESAGEQARVALPQGPYAALGWPDLRRPDAQVLLVGQGEVVALHRQPSGAGLVAAEKGGVLVHAGRLGRTAEERTGRDYPGEGRLFAVDGKMIYVRDGDRVTRWDGTRAQDQGRTSQVTASLLLAWSQR